MRSSGWGSHAERLYVLRSQSCMQLVALFVRLIPRLGCKSAPEIAEAQVSSLNGCHGRVV
jgi:hypothetical protein